MRGALWWERDRGAEQIPRFVERRAAGRAAGDGRFDPGSVKIMQDGIIENRTAALTSPYLSPPSPCGCGGHRAGAVRPAAAPAA